MRELLKRLERLEGLNDEKPAPVGVIFLIGWEEDPTRATKGEEAIDRLEGEPTEAFISRASDYFRPAHGVALVMLDGARHA